MINVLKFLIYIHIFDELEARSNSMLASCPLMALYEEYKFLREVFGFIRNFNLYSHLYIYFWLKIIK